MFFSRADAAPAPVTCYVRRAALAVGMLLLAGGAQATAAATRPLAVMLVPFDASRLPADRRWLGDGIAELTSMGLVQHPAIVQIDRARIRAVSAPEAWDETTVRLTARALHAHAAAYGRVRRQDDRLVIEPLLLNLNTGGIASLPVMTLPDADLLRGLAPLPGLYARALVPTSEAEGARIDRAARPTASLRAFELYTRGQAVLRRGDAEAAVAELLRAIEADPAPFPVAQYALGGAHGVLGNRWKAAAQFRAALQLDPTMPEAHKALGDLFLGAPRSLVGPAIEAYSRAVELRPFYADAWVGLGNARAANSDPESAIAAYETALTFDPFLAGAHVKLGRLWAARGRCPEAEKAYERARELEPGSPDVRCAR